ncbi:MAG: radical SAM family heme chaperone HemW [Synergistaceae bacterium]|nr:radical SAM family heme chaperone HemW [Synergistaceae bacterium]
MSLYVHVPFCEKKCDYCSFYSVECEKNKINSWLENLENEAKIYNREPKIKIKTLFIGGGTPTVLNISQWRELMRILNENFALENVIEATTEANPNSLTLEHLAFFRENNFTRISLGVQSLNDDELKILGRLHDSKKALEAMELVKNFRFSLNCDLIFAIPEQTLRTFATSLKTVIKFADHVSTYQLTLEDDTPLAKKFDNEKLNEIGYKFYRYAQYYLPRKNFIQYEISNFAPEGNECKHNLAYWNQSDVIALGPGAVSYIDGVRYKNPPSIEKYFDEKIIESEKLSPRERKIEKIILALRTKFGISKSELFPETREILNSMPDDLFLKTSDRIALSPRGMRLGNSIWCEILENS